MIIGSYMYPSSLPFHHLLLPGLCGSRKASHRDVQEQAHVPVLGLHGQEGVCGRQGGLGHCSPNNKRSPPVDTGEICKPYSDVLVPILRNRFVYS